MPAESVATIKPSERTTPPLPEGWSLGDLFKSWAPIHLTRYTRIHFNVSSISKHLLLLLLHMNVKCCAFCRSMLGKIFSGSSTARRLTLRPPLHYQRRRRPPFPSFTLAPRHTFTACRYPTRLPHRQLLRVQSAAATAPSAPSAAARTLCGRPRPPLPAVRESRHCSGYLIPTRKCTHEP